MASLNELIAMGELCCCLRAKTMFYEAEGPEDGSLPEGSRSHGNLWCVQTQTPYGPDGAPVGTEECRPGRSCCTTA